MKQPSPQDNPPLWQEIVARDRAYWNKLTAELLARGDFRRNDAATECFSKLRVAIAGVYAFRNLRSEAEYAYNQALQLCPQNVEASSRLSELYDVPRRYGEARILFR